MIAAEQGPRTARGRSARIVALTTILCVIASNLLFLSYYFLANPPEDIFRDSIIITTLISTMVAGPTCWKLVRDAERLRAAKAEAEAANARAEQADRAKSAFLASMSHEIRTPMNGVLGVAELMRHTALDERQRAYLDIISSSGAALLEIVDEVLDLSKVEAGRVELREAPFDPRVLVEYVARLIAARVTGRPVDIMARVSPDVPENLIGDAGRLRQIVVNLAGNAASFTEEGHVLIDLSGAMEDGRCAIILAVEDTGPGVPEAERERIFGAFEQAQDASSAKRKGTGLGLSISASLARLMGGALRAEAASGGGARFVMEAALKVPAARPDARPPTPALEGLRVALASASPLHERILAEALSAAGAATIPPGEALEAGDALLLDWRGEPPGEIEAGIRRAAAAGAFAVILAPFGGAAEAPAGARVLERPCAGAALIEALSAVRAAPSARSAHRL